MLVKISQCVIKYNFRLKTYSLLFVSIFCFQDLTSAHISTSTSTTAAEHVSTFTTTTSTEGPSSTSMSYDELFNGTTVTEILATFRGISLNRLKITTSVNILN